jgi:hypothetical protein
MYFRISELGELLVEGWKTGELQFESRQPLIQRIWSAFSLGGGGPWREGNHPPTTRAASKEM